MPRLAKFILATFILTLPLAAQTSISDTIYAADGSAWAGRIVVAAPKMTCGSTTYAAWSNSYTITAGVVSLSLQPNDLCYVDAGTVNAYKVTYYPTKGTSYLRYWLVPTSATAVKVSNIETSSTPVPQPNTILLGSLSLSGATPGQTPVAGVGSWLLQTVLADPTTTSGDIIYRGASSLQRLGAGAEGKILGISSGLPAWITNTGAVGSVFGRTGAVTAQSGDYSAAQIANTAAGNIAAVTVQAALNELDSEKEPAIASGTASQVWLGNKTWSAITSLGITWGQLVGVPSTFTPSAHNHAGSEITSGTLAAARLPAMVGDSGSGGTAGAVPAPAAGDAAASKYLKADGTWAVPTGSSGVTVEDNNGTSQGTYTTQRFLNSSDITWGFTNLGGGKVGLTPSLSAAVLRPAGTAHGVTGIDYGDLGIANHGYQYDLVANDTSTGTTINRLAKQGSTANTVVIATTSDTANGRGVCVLNCTNSGDARIATSGWAQFYFDGAATKGYLIQASTTTGGQFHAVAACTAGYSVFGIVDETTGGAGLAWGVVQKPFLCPPKTTGTSILKGDNAGGIANAASGTDYAPATSGTAILKGNGSGGFSNAASGTDYAPATSGTSVLKGNGSGGFSNAASGTDYAPATSGTAILKGNGSGGFSNAVSGTDYAPATTGSSVLKASSGGFAAATASDMPTETKTRVIGAVFTGSDVTAGTTVYRRVPFACTISKASIYSDVAGGAVVDVWVDTWVNYPPTVADTITASAKPTLSTANHAEDATLTGWTKSIAAGSVVGFKIDSASTVTRLNVDLECLQ